MGKHKRTNARKRLARKEAAHAQMVAAMAPGFFTTLLRPEPAVMRRLMEAAKMGRTPRVKRMAPRLVTKLLADASVMKNGGMVMNNKV